MNLKLALTASSLLFFSAATACTIGDPDPNDPEDGMGGESGDGDGDGDGDTGDGDGDGDGTGGIGGMGGTTGDGDGDGPACSVDMEPDETIEIFGTYVAPDSIDQTVVITDTTWDTGFTLHHLSIVDNEFGFATALNDETDVLAPCLWSLFVWQDVEGELYYCQAETDAESEAEAALAEWDTEDLVTGCDGFEWIRIE